MAIPDVVGNIRIMHDSNFVSNRANQTHRRNKFFKYNLILMKYFIFITVTYMVMEWIFFEITKSYETPSPHRFSRHHWAALLWKNIRRGKLWNLLSVINHTGTRRFEIWVPRWFLSMLRKFGNTCMLTTFQKWTHFKRTCKFRYFIDFLTNFGKRKETTPYL